jgi:hypothetical protein
MTLKANVIFADSQLINSALLCSNLLKKLVASQCKDRLFSLDYARGYRELAECIRHPEVAPHSSDSAHFPQVENFDNQKP